MDREGAHGDLIARRQGLIQNRFTILYGSRMRTKIANVISSIPELDQGVNRGDCRILKLNVNVALLAEDNLAGIELFDLDQSSIPKDA